MVDKVFRDYTIGLFRSYSVEDFINDPVFRKILKRKDSHQLIEHLKDELPEKRFEIDLACRIISGLNTPKIQQSFDIKQSSWRNILRKNTIHRRIVLLKYAASISIITGIGITVLLLSVFRPVTRIFVASAEPVYENATLILDNGKEVNLGPAKESRIMYANDGKTISLNDSIKLVDENKNTGINHIVVPFGKRTSLLLSDGTRVWINSGSKLTYSPGFKGKTRDVYLEGEGYFEVSKNPEKPFIVHTDSFNIKVFGTSFDVKAYKNDEEVSATLLEGKISLQCNGLSMKNDLILSPEQKATINKDNSGTILVTHVKDIENSISWIDGYFRFENEEFENVLNRVSKYYNINIELTYHRKISNIYGKLDLKDDPELVMDVLALLSHTHYSKDNQKFIFSD